MSIWIVTIGSSDVQLKSDRMNQLEGRSERQLSSSMWLRWFNDLKSDFYNIPFSVVKNNDLDESYRVASRILGGVYQKQADLQDTIFSYLTFPLLDAFLDKFQEHQVPDQVIFVLSDQSKIFDDNFNDRGPKSPYWQDTCELWPILERYIQTKLPNAVLPEPILLQPDSQDHSLDDWNAVLELVRTKFQNLLQYQSQETSSSEIIYVSHQASTPAISSAVQFMALSYFGDRVKFLVSHEQKANSAKVLPGSNYLRQIQKEQAKKMLNRYDYAGVSALFGNYLDPDSQALLQSAIQWNLAEFQEFQNHLPQGYSHVQENRHWWSVGYESAYLAIVRHKQKNIVDALFHSFRSLEGLICQWAENKYPDHIQYNQNGSPQILESIREQHPEYWQKIQEKNQPWLEEQEKSNEKKQAKGQNSVPLSVGLFSQSLYLLFEDVYPGCKKDSYMKKGLYKAKDMRNQQFHRLLALQEQDLFKAWGVDGLKEWKKTLVGCLNFIAQDDIPKAFDSAEEASLMFQVHQDLKQRIDSI